MRGSAALPSVISVAGVQQWMQALERSRQEQALLDALPRPYVFCGLLRSLESYAVGKGRATASESRALVVLASRKTLGNTQLTLFAFQA